MLAHVVLGDLSDRSHQEFEPPDAWTLRADLATADEVPFRDHADQPARLVNHRKAADMMLQHEVCGIQDRACQLSPWSPCGS